MLGSRGDRGPVAWNPVAQRTPDVNNGRVTDLTSRSTGPDRPAADGHGTTDALDPEIAALLKRDAAGLVTAVVQEHGTGQVLMVGWMDDLALHRTLTTGRTTFWSRSREEYWVKGDTTGHVQWVRAVSLDCDGDTLLVQVEQVGAACHTGDRTCFDARPLAVVVGPAATTSLAADVEVGLVGR
ncbi:MAG: Phosphoribosyl-AMP cyclohydrolase [Friedmanniella sp.]|nr:Phosphoribosyl-AMP cyclohydrolase [Friedmanniella sp.]